MNRSSSFLKPLVAAALLACASLSAVATEVPTARPQDEARWGQPDETRAQREATQRKEAVNAYDENKRQCQRESPRDRAGCLSEARELYQRELSQVGHRPRSERPRSSVTEIPLGPNGERLEPKDQRGHRHEGRQNHHGHHGHPGHSQGGHDAHPRH